MYRRPKFQEVLLEIRRQMACDADYDVDLFAEMVRTGAIVKKANRRRPAHKDRDIKDTTVSDMTATSEYKRK